MTERRKNERLCLQGKIVTKRLDLDKKSPVTIDIFDVSKTGIGFKSKSVLPLDYYFNARLVMGGEDRTLYCVVKIIRIDADGESNLYGCEFVGMAPVFDYIFEEYAKSFEE